MNKSIILFLSMLLIIISNVFALDLYVNVTNPNCNNSATRALVGSGTYQWCNLTAPLNNGLMISGDTLYIASGEYNGEADITGRTITSNITITSYPGDQVNLTFFQGTRTKGTANGSNNLWTNLSGGNWYTTETSHDTSFIWVYFSNRTYAITYDTYTNYSQCSKKGFTCSWFNTTSKRVNVHFNNTSINPNNMPIFIASNYPALLIQNNNMSAGAYIIIQNLSVSFIKYGLQIKNQSNVIVRNNSFYGGHYGVYVDGDDVTTNKDVQVYNNYFWGGFNPAWDMDDIKVSNMEISQMYAEDFYGAVYVHNNLFNNSIGPLLLYNDAATEGNGSEIYNNTIINSYGSVFEIEDFAYNVKYHDNLVTSCHYAGVSFAPANCAASPAPCEFYNNRIFCNLTHKEGGVDADAWAIKAESRVAGANNVSNWHIHHNTFWGKDRGLNGMGTSGSGTTAGVFVNTNWTDNIFYTRYEYVLLYTGLATDGNYFNNNLYYIEPGGWQLFRRWNNNSAVGYATLALALASSDWDGTWDTNSRQFNPLFINIENGNFTPTNTSACTMSSTGSYVGATPCAEVEAETATSTNFMINDKSLIIRDKSLLI